MSNKKLEIVLDFLVNLKSDQAQVNRFVSDIEKNAKKLNIEVNTAQAKQAVTEIVNSLSTIDKNAEAVSRAMNDSFGRVDFNKFNNSLSFDKLKSMQSEFDNFFKGASEEKLHSDLLNVAGDLVNLRNEAAKLQTQQESALKVMGASGQKESTSYKAIEEDLNKTKALIKNIDTNLGTDSGKKLGEGINKGFLAGLKLKDLLGNILGVFGGNMLMGGISGVVGSFKGLLEAGKKSLEMTEQMELSFKQAGLSGEELKKQMDSTGKFASKMANDFAVSAGKVREYSATAAMIGGATGKANQDITMLAVGIEKASKGMIDGNAVIRTFSKGLGDPEAQANIGRLKMAFPQLATAIKGIESPAEMTQAALKALNPTFTTLKEQAQGPIGSMTRLQNSLGAIKTNIGRTLVDLFAPLLISIGEEVVPAIQAFSKAMSSSLKFLQEHNGIIKVGAATLGTFAAATWIADGGLTKMGMSIAESGKNILGKLIPGLITQTAATEGATAAQAQFNLAALANPYVLLVAGIAGLVVGLHYLSGALHETAQEKLDAAKADDSLMDKQIELNKSNQERIKNNEDLVRSYEVLGSKSSRTAEEEERYKNVQVELSKSYPGAISGTRSFSENLETLKLKVMESKNELSNLQIEMKGLESKKLDLKVDIKAKEVAVEKEKIEDSLTNALKDITPGWDSAQEWLFGTSNARALGEKIIKPYTNAIYSAKNSKELGDAVQSFQMAILNDKNFQGIDPNSKEKLLSQVAQMGKTQEESIKAQNERTGKLIEASLNDAISKGTITDETIYELAKKTGRPAQEVQKMYDAMKQKAKESKIDEIIKDSVTIKGKINATDNLNDLVKQYEKAGSGIEKAQIGDKIKAIAPEAVKSGELIKDANGNAIQSYSLVKDKIEEAGKAEKSRQQDALSGNMGKIKSMLDDEGKAYEGSFQKMKQLQEQIKNAPKGSDTTGLQREFEQLQQKMNNAKTNILDTGVKLKQSGLASKDVYSMLATELSKSPLEVKRMVEEQEKSKKAAEDQINLAEELGKKWKEATDSSKKSFDENLAALNELSRKPRAQWTDEDKENQANFIKAGKDAYKQMQDQERINKSNEALLGKSKKESVDIYELARKEAEAKTKRLETELKSFELSQQGSIIDEERQRNALDDYMLEQKRLENIKQQKDAWIEALSKRHIYINDKGEVETKLSIKPEKKEEIQNKMESFNNDIHSQANKIKEINLKVTLDAREIQKKFDDLEQKKLELDIELGFKNQDDMTAMYAEQLQKTQEVLKNNKNEEAKLTEELNNKLLEVNKKYGDDLTDAEWEQYNLEWESLNASYGQKINTVKEKQIELLNSEFDGQKKVRDSENKSYEARLKDLKEYSDEAQKALEDRFNKEADALKKFNDAWSKASETKINQKKDNSLDDLKKQEDEQIKVLDKYKEMGTISEEEYQNRKTKITEDGERKRKDIEDKARKEKEVADSVSAGLEKAINNKKAVESAKLSEQENRNKLKAFQERYNLTDEEMTKLIEAEKDADEVRRKASLDIGNKELQDQKRIAEENLKALKPKDASDTDLKEFASTSDALDAAIKTIRDKGDVLKQIGSEIKDGMAETINGLLAGDPDAIAGNARKTLATIAGILEKELSAYVLKLVLSPAVAEFITSSLAATPYLIPVAFAGLTALVNSGVKAIADPIISSLLSFSSGGRIDQPSYAMVGDASRLGGRNREWIFRDEQLIATVQMASAGSNAALVQEIRELKALMSSQELTTTIRGSDIDVALRRTVVHKEGRRK